MDAVAMKHMALNFTKLDKFEGVNFSRWQKMMHFLLSSISVVYVLTTILEDGSDDATMEQIRRRAMWENDDYVCRGLILIDFKHTLKHLKEELTLVELGSHLRIKESLRMQDSDKLKGNNVAGPSVVNMVKHNNSSRYNDNKGKCEHHDNTKVDPNKKFKVTCWKYGKPRHLNKDCKGRKVGNKVNGSGTNGSVDGSTNSLKGQNMFNKSLQVYYITYVSEAYFVKDVTVAWWVNSGATVHVCKDRCWFKTYESLDNGSILCMGNESTALVHGRGCVDLKFSFRNIVLLFNVLHVPNIRKNLVSSSVLNNCGFKQVIESTNFVLSKHDGTIEKFKERLVIQGFKQKSGIDYFDTYALMIDFLNGDLDEEVYINQPQGFIMPSNENKVDLTKEFLSSRFSIKDMREVDVILGIRIKHESNEIAISQSYYIEKQWQAIHRVLKYLKKNKDYKLTYTGYPSVLEGYIDASWISNSKDNSSTSGWVFLLGRGALSWASKKQTCITDSTIESEFVALAAASKEVKWLRKMILRFHFGPNL
nr:zinc finger, CCHC-type [Tanacetum cinerariifolium]